MEKEKIEKVNTPDVKIEGLREIMEDVIKDAHSEKEAIELVKNALPKDVVFMGPRGFYREDIMGDQIIRQIQVQIQCLEANGHSYTVEANYTGE